MDYPLDPQDVGVGVFAAQQRSASLTRRSVTCGLLGHVHAVWSPRRAVGKRTRSPRFEQVPGQLARVADAGRALPEPEVVV